MYRRDFYKTKIVIFYISVVLFMVGMWEMPSLWQICGNLTIKHNNSAMAWTHEMLWFNFHHSHGIFSFSKQPDQLCIPTQIIPDTLLLYPHSLLNRRLSEPHSMMDNTEKSTNVSPSPWLPSLWQNDCTACTVILIWGLNSGCKWNEKEIYR
jgi:hypothetical protein